MCRLSWNLGASNSWKPQGCTGMYRDCFTFYPRLNLSTTPDLQFYKPQHCTVLDTITGNFKAAWFCRILDRFTRRAKTSRIIGGPDNRLPDEWSSTVCNLLRIKTGEFQWCTVPTCRTELRWKWRLLKPKKTSMCDGELKTVHSVLRFRYVFENQRIGVRSPAEAEILSSSSSSRQVLRHIQCLQGLKRSAHKADHSPLSSVEGYETVESFLHSWVLNNL